MSRSKDIVIQSF